MQLTIKVHAVVCVDTPSPAHPTCRVQVSVHIWKNSEQLTMTRAGAICMSVGVKTDWTLNRMAGLSGRRIRAGSAGVYTGVLKSQPSNKKLSDPMAYDDLCATIGTSKIRLIPQHMFCWACGPWHPCGISTRHRTKHNYIRKHCGRSTVNGTYISVYIFFFFLSETRAFIFILQIGKNKTKGTQCLCLPAKGIKKWASLIIIWIGNQEEWSNTSWKEKIICWYLSCSSGPGWGWISVVVFWDT